MPTPTQTTAETQTLFAEAYADAPCLCAWCGVNEAPVGIPCASCAAMEDLGDYDPDAEEGEEWRPLYSATLPPTPRSDFAEAFAEVMEAFNWNRSRWIDLYGEDEGFERWFTAQVPGMERLV